MVVFWVTYISIVLLYTFVIVSFAIGWKKIRISGTDNQPNNFVFFSIIVAFRNEINCIGKLVERLNQLEYPKDNFEIILVNDHSDDGSFEKLVQQIGNQQNINLLNLTSDEWGKKSALKKGSSYARGELCVFTDADCLPPVKWLLELNNYYRLQGKPDLIIGLVDLRSCNTFIQKCFRLEFLSLILSSAGAASLNHPVMCNGANLAVKREEYLKINNLHDEIATGDDVFLLHAFKKEKKSIKVLKSHNHIVSTSPPSSVYEFIKQRTRWGSKAPRYSDFDSIALSLIILFVNLIHIPALILGIVHSSLLIVLGGFALKSLADLTLFIFGSRFFRLNYSLLLIPLLEFFYPFYIAITTIMIIKKPFDWKGRFISL